MGKSKFKQVLYMDESNTKKALGGEPCENIGEKSSYIKITIRGTIYGFGGFAVNGKVMLVDFSERKIGGEYTGINVRKKIIQKLGSKACVDIVPTTLKLNNSSVKYQL